MAIHQWQLERLYVYCPCLPAYRALQFSRFLLGRCFWNSYSSVTPREELYVQVYQGQSSSSSKSFTWKIVLKWPFFGDTRDKMLHTHCSDLLGDRALWVSSSLHGCCLEIAICWWFWRILHVHCSVLPGHRALWADHFTWKMVWKWLFIGNTWEDPAHSLFKSSRIQNSSLWWSSTQKLVFCWSS